jgi:hypothetical protein
MEQRDNIDKSVIKWDTLVHNGPYFKYLSPYSDTLPAEQGPISSIILLISEDDDSIRQLTLENELVDYAILFVHQLRTNANIKGAVEVWNPEKAGKFLNVEEIYKNEYASMLMSNFFYGRMSATKPIKGFIQYVSDANGGYRPDINNINWENVLKLNKSTLAQRKILEANLTEHREKYGFCSVDGVMTEIKKFDIPRPSLYIPKDKDKYMTSLGLIKKEILPEDVIINSSNIVKCPDNHNWKDTIEDHNTEWLWKWEDNVISRGNRWGKESYGYPADTSKIKINSAVNRYDDARILNELSQNIIQQQINDAYIILENNEPKALKNIQKIICIYLLFTQGFRIDSTSSSKNEDVEPVVGLCGLTYDNVKMLKWNDEVKTLYFAEDGENPTNIGFLDEKDYTITIDFNITDTTKDGDYVWFAFKGKDNVFCYRLAHIDSSIWELLKILKEYRKKSSDHKLFKGLNSDDINIWLKTYTENNTISAKTVRTQVASKFMYENLEFYTKQNQDELKNATKNATKKLIKKIFNLANTDVAKFLNHKQTGRKSSWNLDTSINRYIDPRIIVSWCLKNDVPINDIFNPTRQVDFAWAIKQTPSGNIWNWTDTQPEIISKLCESKEELGDNKIKLINVLYKNNRIFFINYITKLFNSKSSQLNTIDKNFIDKILSYTK